MKSASLSSSTSTFSGSDNPMGRLSRAVLSSPVSTDYSGCQALETWLVQIKMCCKNEIYTEF